MSVRAPLPGHSDEEILKLARRANQSIFWRTCAILSIVATGVVGFVAATASRDAAQASRDVKRTQIAGCEASIRPNGVRYIDADNIQRQQDRSDALGLDKQQTAAAFGITVKRLERLQADQRADAAAQIKALLDVDCSTGRAIPLNSPNFVPPPHLGEATPQPAGGNAGSGSGTGAGGGQIPGSGQSGGTGGTTGGSPGSPGSGGSGSPGSTGRPGPAGPPGPSGSPGSTGGGGGAAGDSVGDTLCEVTPPLCGPVRAVGL